MTDPKTTDQGKRTPPDLSKLRSPADAPRDGGQFIAWAIDEHSGGRGRPDPHPRWVIAHWAGSYIGDEPFWRWSVPGRETSVKILGWLPLPWNDAYGNYVLGIEPEGEAS